VCRQNKKMVGSLIQPPKAMSVRDAERLFEYREEPRNCTGFCTDCLHPGLTGVYWPFRGTLLEVIEAKGRRFIIISL
jgi:hypothetical protein